MRLLRSGELVERVGAGKEAHPTSQTPFSPLRSAFETILTGRVQ